MPSNQFPPRNSCDCHVHVVGPKTRYAFTSERTYTPMDAPTEHLRAMLNRLCLDRVVLVQISVYGYDNACMLDALDRLENARAVAVLPPGTSDSVLDDLHQRGVRGLRVNIATSGSPPPEKIREQLLAAAALCERNGWHVQTFVQAEAIEPLEKVFLDFPVPIVIDHFGLIKPGAANGALRSLVRLLQSGHIWVKISGAYRIADDLNDPRIDTLARTLTSANPDRIVWGSDWPHTPPHANSQVSYEIEQPYQNIDTGALLRLLPRWLVDERLVHKVLVENPARLYDFR
jgi:predicted TIM-barrel fold metal-dependent hydrolase